MQGEMKDQFIRLIEKAHEGQQYKGGVPYKHHLHRVARLIEYLTKKNGEDFSDGLFQAALGHDALEDTKITEEELREFCDDKTMSWLRALTCHEDAPPRTQYMNQLKSADEEVWLIKLADLFDNMTTACRRINENGVKWTTDWFLPIIEEQYVALQNSNFSRYLKSGAQLVLWCDYALQTLKQEISRWS